MTVIKCVVFNLQQNTVERMLGTEVILKKLIFMYKYFSLIVKIKPYCFYSYVYSMVLTPWSASWEPLRDETRDRDGM